MTPDRHQPLTACLLLTLLAVSLGSVSGQPVGNLAQDLILDALTLSDRIGYSVDGPSQLDELSKTVEMTMPALADMPYTTELFAQVVVSNGVPQGHMRAVLARLRGGRSKRLGSVSARFGPTLSHPPLGSALFFTPIDADEFETGDILTITFSFNTNGHQLRRGDQVFVNLDWEFWAFAGLPGAARNPFALSGAKALDKLSLASRQAGSQHAQLHQFEEGTALSEVEVELEMPIPASLDGSYAEEMLVFAGAIAGTMGGEFPGGRVRFRLVRYPADGGRRQILLNMSVKQEDAVIVEGVPTPEGFGVGDRIVFEIYFRTDWIAPAGGLIEARAQFVPINDL